MKRIYLFCLIIVILCSGCSKLFDTNVYVSTEPIPDDETLIEIFNKELKEYTFEEVPLFEDESKYVKMIDDIQTSDIYFVRRDLQGNIIEIKTGTDTLPQVSYDAVNRLKKHFKGFTEIDTTAINQELSNDGKSSIEIRWQTQENYYYVLDGKLIPVSTVRTEYKTDYGAIIQDLKVYNRLDNSSIPLEDIYN